MTYYEKYLNAVYSGKPIERRLFLSTGDEALYLDGALYASTSTHLSFENADISEIIRPLPHLFLFGAGHVGKALYDIAALLKYKITILDDRENMLTEERFPKAERHVGPFPQLLEKEYSAPCPYYVIFTHGHKEDKRCLDYALKHNSSYIGMIGSKSKVASLFSSLTEEEIKRVHAPIGIKINAESSEEIAVSIAAEIIDVFRSGKKIIIEDPEIAKVLAAEKGVVIRIVSSEGSGPGKIGFTMLVNEKEEFGTVGGGAIEKDAVESARKMLKQNTPYLLKEYDLSEKGELGMLCGGKCKLIFRLSP